METKEPKTLLAPLTDCNNPLLSMVGHRTDGDESYISGNIDENQQEIGAITESSVVGANVNGNDNFSIAGSGNFIQTNNVTTNNGITGITGSGHTINNYTVDLKMLIELLKKDAI